MARSCLQNKKTLPDFLFVARFSNSGYLKYGKRYHTLKTDTDNFLVFKCCTTFEAERWQNVHRLT